MNRRTNVLFAFRISLFKFSAMKPKAKSKELPYPFNVVLTKEQWEIGSLKMRKTIDKHKELARLFQKKNPNHTPKAPDEEPMTY